MPVHRSIIWRYRTFPTGRKFVHFSEGSFQQASFRSPLISLGALFAELFQRNSDGEQ